MRDPQRRLFSMEQALQFEPGSYLIRQGDLDTHAFVIESGSVKISLKDGDQEQILGIAGTGEVIGEMALFEDAPRSASVIAVEPTLARKMTRQRLKDLTQLDPGACMPYLRAILERLRTSNTMLLAAQQTKELLKTMRVRLSFEPVSELAVQVCPRRAVIELDVVPSEASTQVLIQGLQKHFKVGVETFFPKMGH
ncbi:MAG: cyclic nucleotide-binding domain-containing protein [Verrucomicrobia bacterium]|nr:cyclic nucleotide-binding domain-containing protein [Verrucomicrobiota bacterium]